MSCYYKIYYIPNLRFDGVMLHFLINPTVEVEEQDT
jgi:hypothetical protein